MDTYIHLTLPMRREAALVSRSMDRSRWRVPVPGWRGSALAASITIAAIGLTACGGESPASRVSVSGVPASAGAVAQPGPITTAKLVGALLTRINGEPAAAPAASGRYDSLPQVKAATKHAGDAVASARPCAQAQATGLQPGGLGSVPAAVVSFKVGRNGVSEMLAAPSSKVADTVLRRSLPSACTHQRFSVGGQNVQYTAKEANISGIGQQARVLSLRAADQPAGNIWSVVFRGPGFIGSVTVVGPDASELAVRELGLQAYGFAAKSLS